MISVIVPYKEDRGHLSECVRSILEQTYKDIELIPICNNKTVGYNFNRGLELAKGELVKYVCEDDWLPRDAIKLLVDGMGNYDWICANALRVWRLEQTVDVSCRFTFEEALEHNGIHGGTTLYKTDMLREIGGMDERLQTAEEYDMHLKLMSLGHLPGYIDKIVYFYRVWDKQKNKQHRLLKPEWRKAQHEMIKDRYR